MDKQKEAIIRKLKENGCRITRQRLEILDIILEDQCSSCKEIYYRASESDSKIGIATVYRMVNALEEIGVVSRRLVYRPAGAGRGSAGQSRSASKKKGRNGEQKKREDS